METITKESKLEKLRRLYKDKFDTMSKLKRKRESLNGIIGRIHEDMQYLYDDIKKLEDKS